MQQALPLGLVDEIRVQVIPVLLGGGTPMFDARQQTTDRDGRRDVQDEVKGVAGQPRTDSVGEGEGLGDDLDVQPTPDSSRN